MPSVTMDTFVENFCQGEPIWDTNLTWNTTTPRVTRCFMKTIPIWIPSIFLWILAPFEAYRILTSGHFRSRRRQGTAYTVQPIDKPRQASIPFNRYNISRLIAVASIVILNGAQFAYDFGAWLEPDSFRLVSAADLTSSVLNCLTFTLFGYLIALHRAIGKHTSGLAFFFTFIATIVCLPSIYMYSMFFGDDQVLTDPHRTGMQHWSLLEMCLFSAHFGLLFFVFLLTCFADRGLSSSSSYSAKRERCCAESGMVRTDAFNAFGSVRTIATDEKQQAEEEEAEERENLLELKTIINGAAAPIKLDNDNTVADRHELNGTNNRSSGEIDLKDCPQSESSFLSQHTFWWFNALAITGFRKSLTLSDLWRLNPEDSTDCIAPKFDRAWLAQIKQQPTAAAMATQLNGVEEAAPTAAADSVSSVTIRQPSASGQPGTFVALSRTFGLYFLSGSIFKLGHDLIQFVNPLLLKAFIGFISKPADVEPIWHGLVIAIMFFVVSMAQSFMLNYYFTVMFTIGMRVRTALTSAIYRKSMNLSNDARRQTTSGEIVNLMSVDAQKFVDLLPFINLVWSAPLQIILTVAFLWYELGPSVMAGLAVMVALLPLNAYLSAYQRRLQIAQMKKKDERVKVINEALSGIRVIKLYGWEVPFIGRISAVRNAEIHQLAIISYLSAVTSFLWTCAPFLVSFVTFAIYVLSSSENVLDAKKAFVSLSLFNLLRFPLTMLPMMITSLVMASVSIKRVNKFLNSNQLTKYVSRKPLTDGDAITIVGGEFVWETAENNNNDASDTTKQQSQPQQQQISKVTDANSTAKIEGDESERSPLYADNNGTNGKKDENGSDAPTSGSTNQATPPSSNIFSLTGIDLRIKKGSMVAIVGHVGAGKSSLLSAILGDMQHRAGTVSVDRAESVAYVAQQAWIRNATLRDNILFGSPFAKSRYDQVLEMCALKPDIAVLPGGDRTEIGEKGINLSGGQKQRVAIARACYSAASLVLLDDPLSAVDSHVARHIFAKVLATSGGYLRDRTRVMVTNNISLLPDVDQIIVLSSGAISEIGTYEQLMRNSGKFADFVREHSNERKQEDIEAENEPITPTSERSSGSFRVRTISETKSGSLHRAKSDSVSHGADGERKLIEAELTETGNVRIGIYLNYFRSLTYFWLSMMIIGFVLMQAISVGSSVWLAIWSNDAAVKAARNATIVDDNANRTNQYEEADISLRNYRLSVYGILGFGQAIFVLLGALAMARGTVHSSRTLHSSLLFRIMRSPMSFFDTTPLGRIVNRFSKDIDTIDATIPHTLRGWILCFMQVVSTFILIGFEIPAFILVAIPIIALYYFIQKFYVATSRQLKRLESVTRSPIYSHFGETLSGVHTIRAFGATARFIANSSAIVDTNQRCYYPSFIANRWLALRLEFCGNLIVFAAASFAVLSREQLQPGYVGLILTYALSVTQTLNWLVRMTSELETNIVSVERIGEYCENSTEKEWRRAANADPAIPDRWPESGAVEFADYSVRYRDGLPCVLDRISLRIDAGEKIGIVGRTGAGKSSLTLALFRLLEAAAGRIVIDDIDIGKIGLHELRSKLSIIPQDPVLFSGTIRSNLDPFDAYSDEHLWQALEHSHLKDYIASQEAGLDYAVAENGENLSVGQRQLICLGRALLRRTKILVLDEATAAIDLETDALIQRTIRAEFAHCTVLTIAHRLNTIMDSTRVLVLEKGKIAEFDSPQSLLADRRTRFYALAKDARLV